MDMQKEREAFKAWFKKEYLGIDDLANQGDEGAITRRDYAYVGWQAAKAQAVPEGYVLASKEPSADLVDHGHQVFLGHFNEGGQTGGRSLYFAYKAMIEAQESTND